MFHLGLTIQFTIGLCLLLVNVFQLPFIFMVISVVGYIGCISMISLNAMGIILEDFPFMAGTVASLVGTLRFGTGGIIGFLLLMIPIYNALANSRIYGCLRNYFHIVCLLVYK